MVCRSQPITASADIVERLRSEAADAIDWNGQTMKRWDEIRALAAKNDGSDLPRLMFESLVEGLAELIIDGADEIESIRAQLEGVLESYGSLAEEANKMVTQLASARKALEGAEEWLSGWASAEPYISDIRAALKELSK